MREFPGLSLRSVPPVALPEPVIQAEVTRDDWNRTPLGGGDGWLARLSPSTDPKRRFDREYVEPDRMFLGSPNAAYPDLAVGNCEAALLVEWQICKLPDGVYHCKSYVAPWSHRGQARFKKRDVNNMACGAGGSWLLLILDGEFAEMLTGVEEACPLVKLFAEGRKPAFVAPQGTL